MDDDIIPRIHGLDDISALRLLKTISDAKSVGQRPAAIDWIVALETYLASSPAGGALVDSDAARLALELLAGEPSYAATLAQMFAGRPAKKFIDVGPVTGMVLGSAILFVLQTHIEFEREKSGKWRLKVIKKPTNSNLLSPLVKKLLTLMHGR